MMLSGRTILSETDRPSDDGSLFIAPAPDAEAIRKSNAASVDLRLGRWFLAFRQTRTKSVPLVIDEETHTSPNRTAQHFVQFGTSYILHPGAFVLGSTLEWLSLPGDLAGYVTGKSSLGRHGLVIETAAGIHPYFSGCLTLELANVGEVPLEIFPGMPICQIFFHRVEGKSTETPHIRGSQFSGSRRPKLQTPKADDTFNRLRASSKQPDV
jgi:dCTP deaminase